jgi:transcriptional regulator with GAF, ATPase, and Fis domain
VNVVSGTGEHQLWGAFRALLERVTTSVNRESFLDDVLDTVVELLDADRGLLLLTNADGATHVINARAKGRALNAYEREEISKTIIHQVHSTGQAVFWEPDLDSRGTESMSMLGIMTALAAPLHTLWQGSEGPVPRGVVYVDFRDHRKETSESQRQLLETIASVVSVVLDQSQRLTATEERIREADARDAAADPGPSIDELLRFKSMEPLRREVQACLRSDSPILIEGESGVGKTLLARAVAEAGGLTPVVRSTLGSSDDLNTITSELFGHERGSFSGAMTKRTGLVEFANGGTLILDEILNLPLHAQQLLLDFTQFGTYRPLGYEKPDPRKAQVRLIAATNGDLRKAVAEGRFRQDLYYRLQGVTLYLPPLRERREDIPALAEGFLRRDGGVPWRLSVKLRRLLLSPEIVWEGNIRQLESVIRRARDRALAEDADAELLTLDHVLPRDLGLQALDVPAPTSVPDPGKPLCSAFQIETDELGDSWRRLLAERDHLQTFEKQIIELALEKHNGVVAYVARELGMPRTSLVSRIKTLGIKQ